MVLNSLSFCFCVNDLISPLNLNESLLSNLGCRFFSFITLNMSFHALPAFRVSAERSAVNLMGIPLYGISCFSLAAFNIFSLYLIFVIWLIYVLVCFSLDVSSLGLCASWTWLTISFHILRKLSIIISSNIYSVPFFFFFFFCNPYNLNAGVFNVVSEVSQPVLNSFHSFFFILLCGSYFHCFIFQVSFFFFFRWTDYFIGQEQIAQVYHSTKSRKVISDGPCLTALTLLLLKII